MEAMRAAYEAIGRAVVAMQWFEEVMVPLVEFHRMVTEPSYMETTKGLVPEGKYRNPITNLVKWLSDNDRISPELKRDIDALLEERHLVIHRWGSKNGFSTRDDDEGWCEYEAAAVRVEREAMRITGLLRAYLGNWTEPAGALANPDEYVLKIKNLFRAE